jgi:N-acetylmuramoyl-L-alanine amidase
MFEFMKDQYTDRSITCADFIQTKMIQTSKRNDRGVRQAGFLVLRATAMPSVLVELGFISNKDEEKYLNNNENQVKLATAIFNGIKEYKHELDKKSGNSNSEELEVRSEELKNDVTLEDKNEKLPATQMISGVAQQNSSKLDSAFTSTEIPNSEYEFFIQYLVSKNNYKEDNAVFKGHTPTKIINENKLFKYLVGPYDVNTVFNKRNEITKDFPDAFIVAYKEGKKVSTPEAIQEAKDKLK